MFFREEAVFSSSISNLENRCPRIDCDVLKSFTELATSISLTQRIPSEKQPEQEHTSVLKLVLHPEKDEGTMNVPKCISEI